MPLISVIMNVRNGASFLRPALDSVLAQTFADWELIIWDDCSTDGSASIVAEYRDRRIRYFLAPEETPLGKARENAIHQATGEWLAFLDQDDVWLRRKLEKQMALADRNVGLIYGRTLLFYPDGSRRDYDYAHEFTDLPEGNIFDQLFQDACFIAMSSAVIRRSAVEEAGGIPSAVQIVPDYCLYIAVANKYQTRAVQEVVCRYRMHTGNMSRTNRLRLRAEPLWLLDRWADHLDPKLLKYRRMTYSSVLALEEMRSRKSFVAGLRRLLTHGSLLWLLQRPFVHVFRAVRRKLWRPYWRATASASASD
jgi:glycosyltransferase involved in cell wall biosynthesis